MYFGPGPFPRWLAVMSVVLVALVVGVSLWLAVDYWLL